MKKMKYLFSGICVLLILVLAVVFNNNFAKGIYLRMIDVFLEYGVIQTNKLENTNYDEKCGEITKKTLNTNFKKQSLNEEEKAEFNDLVYRKYSQGHEINVGCFLRVDKETLSKVCEHPQYVVIYVDGQETARIAISDENIEYQTIKSGNYEFYLVDMDGHYCDILSEVKVDEPVGGFIILD